MTDRSDDLKARARRAFEQSTTQDRGPVDPEALAKLERALLQLPRLTRAIFIAHRVHGLGYDEIAAHTGLDRRQVERRMAEALYHLDRFTHGDTRAPRQRWWRVQWQCWWQAQWRRWFRR